MTNALCQVSYDNQNKIIGSRIEVASSFWARFRGLMGRKSLAEGEGLLLVPCSSIHCLGMKFAIDAIFLDKEYRVVDIHPNMKPGAIASHRNAHSILELKAGEADSHQVQIGERLKLEFMQK